LTSASQYSDAIERTHRLTGNATRLCAAALTMGRLAA
jgi:hypothetical protein